MSYQSTSAINTQLQLYMPGITILKNDFTKKNRKKKGRNLKKKFHVRHNEDDEAFFYVNLPGTTKFKYERKSEMNQSGISKPLALHYQDTNFH